jgi:phosphatidylinositol alpha-mannosyltransferase
MRIGLISFHTFSQPGGVKKHVLGLQKEFKKRGIQSKVIAPRRKKSENYGKDVILLGTSFPFHVAGTQADLCINFNPLAIRKVLKREKFDVLHFHNFGFPSALQILERSDVLNILTLHANLEASSFLKSFPGSLYIFNKIVQWKIDGVIGVAPLTLEIFKGFKGPETVIPNGIDLEEFNPGVPKIKKFLDGKINILFLGRIEERKGLIYLLKAYKLLEKKLGGSWVKSNLRLIVVGDGPLKNDCQDWAKKNRLKNVVFEREIKEKEVPSYYQSSDIYCSPAIYGESFGIVLIEAMAVGKPVVAFANRGYKGVLEKGKGRKFLVKPRDYKTLAKKLEILIKNPRLRGEMGKWGIKEAKKYSWPKIADQVLAFYKLCSKKK